MVTSPNTAKMTGRLPVSVRTPVGVMSMPDTGSSTVGTPLLWLNVIGVSVDDVGHDELKRSMSLSNATLQVMVSTPPMPESGIVARLKLLGVYGKRLTLQTPPVEHTPPSQGVPAAALTYWQPPSPRHVPPVWQSGGALQVKPVPAQTPLLQMSPAVHALPSSHGPERDMYSHMPLATLHSPDGETQPPSSVIVHVTCVPAQPASPWQASLTVQRLPSSQARFSATAYVHAPPVQAPASAKHGPGGVVHAGPPWQLKSARHVGLGMQALPASQAWLRQLGSWQSVRLLWSSSMPFAQFVSMPFGAH